MTLPKDITSANRRRAEERRRLERTKPGATGIKGQTQDRVQHIKTSRPDRPTTREGRDAAREELRRKAMDNPKANGARAATLAKRLKAQMTKGTRLKGTPAQIPTSNNPPGNAPALPPGDDWPSKAQCCWPTNSARPWTFCRAKSSETSRHGYCAEHERMSYSKSAPGGQIDARDMSTKTGVFIVPRGQGNPRKGALASSVKARAKLL